jgi:hypothetical protein
MITFLINIFMKINLLKLFISYIHLKKIGGFQRSCSEGKKY